MWVATVFGLTTRACRDLRLGLALGEQREDLALAPAEVEVVRRLPVPVRRSERRRPTAAVSDEHAREAPPDRRVSPDSRPRRASAPRRDPERRCDRPRRGSRGGRRRTSREARAAARARSDESRELDLDDRKHRTISVEPLEQQLRVLRGADLVAKAHGHADRQRAGGVVVVDDQNRAAVHSQFSRSASCAEKRWKSRCPP